MSRFVIINCAQDTPEWREARLGLATGSKAPCILAQGRTKGTEATTRRDYLVQLVTERFTGEPQENDFESAYMRAGKENEPRLHMAYERATRILLREIGFAALTEIAAGCSPDGLVDDDPEGFGLIEGKCPKPAIHLRYRMEARVPPEYWAQCMHNLYVLDAAWVDFVSYCPKLPDYLQLFRVRAYRSEFDLKAYEIELLRFLKECDELEARLRAQAPLKAAA